jgi:hypothetical protein
MIVTSLRYQTIEGGALGGHFALHVTLGGASNGPSEFSPTELSTKIHDCFTKLDLKAKLLTGILFDCRMNLLPGMVNPNFTSEDMISLLGTLKDWGHNIVLWVDETTRYAWFEYASYITVFVHSKNWPNFRVNEIRYESPTDGEWLEPEVFEVNQNATAYLKPEKIDTKSVIKFILESKRAWGVIIPTRGVPAIDFKLQGDL